MIPPAEPTLCHVPEDPHLWPEHTAATLLAGLAATREADQAKRFARLLLGGAA